MEYAWFAFWNDGKSLRELSLSMNAFSVSFRVLIFPLANDCVGDCWRAIAHRGVRVVIGSLARGFKGFIRQAYCPPLSAYCRVKCVLGQRDNNVVTSAGDD